MTVQQADINHWIRQIDDMIAKLTKVPVEEGDGRIADAVDQLGLMRDWLRFELSEVAEQTVARPFEIRSV